MARSYAERASFTTPPHPPVLPVAVMRQYPYAELQALYKTGTYFLSQIHTQVPMVTIHSGGGGVPNFTLGPSYRRIPLTQNHFCQLPSEFSTVLHSPLCPFKVHHCLFRYQRPGLFTRLPGWLYQMAVASFGYKVLHIKSPWLASKSLVVLWAPLCLKWQFAYPNLEFLHTRTYELTDIVLPMPERPER